MTALLGTSYEREPTDCPFTWGDGYVPCTYHDLPVHRCLIQGGHDGSCLCMCLDEPPPVLPRPQRFNWTGYLDECLAEWPNHGDVPCNAELPTLSHMCYDGDDAGDYGHNAEQHTCRCATTVPVERAVALERLARRERRYRRDARHVYDPEVTP